MNTKVRNRILAVTLATLSVGLTGTTAKAAVTTIYADAFDGTAGPVAGRALTSNGVAGGTAGATWTSDAAGGTASGTVSTQVFTASGGAHTTADSTFASVGALSTGVDSGLITNAYLPFTPQAGYLYDFHMDILPSGVGASGNWLGMAFAQAGLNGHPPSGSASALSNDNPYGLIILKGSGVTQGFAGLGTGAQQTLANATNTTSATVGSPYNSVDILLDTRGTNYQLNWIVNGQTELATPYTYATNPTIGAIIFGANKLTGQVANFSLTATPEPGSLALLGLGGLVSLRRRRSA